MNTYNGRVLFTAPNNLSYDRTKQDIKEDTFKAEAVKGIIEKSPLSDLFFSQINIDALQEGIRYVVYKKSCSKFTIDNQSEDELKTIMRAIYLQDAKHQMYGILEQVRDLNSTVIDYCCERIVKEINMYIKYKQDISALPVPMAYGESTSIAGMKQLERKQF